MGEPFFRFFDKDESGSLDFDEYMMCKNAPDMDKPEERLKWIFQAFDK